METNDETLGLVKIDSSGKLANDLADKINLVPYGGSKDDDTFNDTDADFIPFKFRDVVNGKWIIFRAILSGINDSVSPDWGDTRFVGRPDKVFVYKGVDRTISFDFDIYPKTKQELPVLWEKINYLMGEKLPNSFNQTIEHFKNHKDCVLIFVRDSNLKSVSETLRGYKSRNYYKSGQDKLIKNYGIGAQIIKALNIKNMILVTRSRKKVVGLDGYGIKINRQEIIK